MTEDVGCRLYLISPSEIVDYHAFARELDAVFSAGDVACFQLRLKGAEDDHILAAAEIIMPVCVNHDVAFIINDSISLAKASGADGVHLGQGDGTVDEAKNALGEDAIVGVTCHDSKHLAYNAGEAGADYVAFGAFFDSPTKDTGIRPELELLTGWDQATEVPCVAIGGITVDNCKALADAGAHFVATCSGVWSYEQGAVAAVADFQKALQGV